VSFPLDLDPEFPGPGFAGVGPPMCTLIALHRCLPDVPLVVAANRDEYLDRPSEGPATRAGGIVAPLDLRAGGTWLGVNPAGVFAAVTNRPGPPDPARRSRGLLVLDALAAESAVEAAVLLRRLPERAYNGFNLFVADAEDAFVAVYRDAVRVTALAPGAHVIGNADPDDRGVPKVARLLDAVAPLAGAPLAVAWRRLAAVCRGHDGGGSPLDDTCIHAGGYGTRSSTLLALGAPGVPDRLRFAGGPPCRTAYADLDPLLASPASYGAPYAPSDARASNLE